MTSHSFFSRLTLVGDYVLDSPLHIGNGPDGVATDAEDRPLIPGSTFRGALRAYIESVLRGVETDQHTTRQSVTLRGSDGRPVTNTRVVRLACDSTDKRDDDLQYQGCLTRAIVTRWESDPVLRPKLDSALADCTCQICRLFGAPWLAGRVHIADLVARDWKGSLLRRGGLAISRDRDVMIEGSSYQREAVPPGTSFGFQLVAENVTPVEQGMILLGLRAFEAGLIALGGDRARGLGYGHLAIDWWNCRYVDADHLISTLLGNDPQIFTDSEAETRIDALAAVLRNP